MTNVLAYNIGYDCKSGGVIYESECTSMGFLLVSVAIRLRFVDRVRRIYVYMANVADPCPHHPLWPITLTLGRRLCEQ